MENIVKKSFETKTGVESIIRVRTHKKYTPTEPTDKKTKKLPRKKLNKRSFVPKQTESKSTVTDVLNFMMK